MTAAIATAWWIGWAIGLVVVLVAAALLVAIIGLGRRISGAAREIDAALDRTRENTAPLFDLAKVNLAMDRIARGLVELRNRDVT